MVSDYRSSRLLCKADPSGLLLAISTCGACVGSLHFNRVFRGGEKRTLAEMRKEDVSIAEQACVQRQWQESRTGSRRAWWQRWVWEDTWLLHRPVLSTSPSTCHMGVGAQCMEWKKMNELQFIGEVRSINVQETGSSVWLGNREVGASLVVQWLILNAGGPGSIPGQGTRSHMPQLRVRLPQLNILCATTKTWRTQINK